MTKNPQNTAALAEYFGLSRSAVSYILNGKWSQRRISQATAEKVLKFVQKTGFQPDPLGLALKGRAIKDIAIIIPAEPYEHHKEAYFRLLSSLEAQGSSYVVLPTANEKLSETARFLRMYGVRRIVVFATGMCVTNRDAWMDLFGNMGQATVCLYDFPFEVLDPQAFLSQGSVAIGINRDHAKGLVMKALVERGYRDLLIPGCWASTLEGLLPARIAVSMRSYRDDYGAVSLAENGRLVAQGLATSIKKGVAQAVFVPDDKLSWAVIRALELEGVRVPDDVALCSWDGLPESVLFSPALTTLVIPHSAMLSLAMAWLGGERVDQAVVLSAFIREGQTLPFSGHAR